MIDYYRFGEFVIDGVSYQKDLILSKNQIVPNWIRLKAYLLSLSDIKKSVEENRPEIVVVGTGKFGLMKVSTEVKNFLVKNNIYLHIKPTDKAVELFNSFLSKENNVLGFFHLTC